jgi:hypothetical protein
VEVAATNGHTSMPVFQQNSTSSIGNMNAANTDSTLNDMTLAPALNFDASAFHDSDYGFNAANDASSPLYADFLKDLLFANPLDQQDFTNGQGTRTPNLWDSGPTLSDHFGDALAGVPYGDFPTVSGFDLFVPVPEDSVELNGQSPEQRAIAAGGEAFSTSVWHWVPSPADHGAAEHAGLALPSNITNTNDSLSLSVDVRSKRLRASDRERVLAILFEQCDKEHVVKVATAFPSHHLMEKLFQAALHFQTVGTLPFLHIATLDPAAICDELLTCLVAYGAFLSPVPSIQHLGAAMADIMFMVLPQRFCANNANTRELQLLQSFALFLHILFWSGNKRRTEIGESFAQPLITMLRRANRMSRHYYNSVVPSSGDNPSQLDSIWRAWARQESLIRLVYHCYFHDTQASMTLFTSPLLTAAEMTLPLPAADALWNAGNADQWQESYRTMTSDQLPSQTLSARANTLLRNAPAFGAPDFQGDSISDGLTLLGTWHFIFMHQLLYCWRANGGFQDTLHDLESPAGYGVLGRALQNAERHMHAPSTLDTHSLAQFVTLEYLQLALNAPLKSFPVFAGKDGEGESRIVYPMIQQWACTEKSRKAIWHSGQLLRYARSLPRTLLQTFYGVAVYHASLTLWTYSIIASARYRRSGWESKTHSSPYHETGMRSLRLDDSATTAEVNEFVALDSYSPVITVDLIPLLFNPGAAMNAGIAIFGTQSTGPTRNVSRFVDSLIQLMDGLARAAQSLGFG